MMKLLARPHGKSLPMALAAAILMSTSPIFIGCSRGDESHTSPSPSATTEQPTPAAPTAAAAPTTAVPTTGVPSAPANQTPGSAPGAASAQELQELVSPIALYPDLLVAQILAGSTYPTQVVEAARWIQQNPNLTGNALAAQVNQQPWDPSIKSLTQFPSVLQTMNDSLAWTSALGEAYYNQPADVMNAIQILRNKAMEAGNLKTTAQQTVEVPASSAEPGGGQPSVQQTVIIQPAQPNTVYLPQYNPSAVYGAPIQSPPGYTGTDLLLTGVLSFGAGILLGSLINNGNNNWGCNWNGGYNSSVRYNNNVYVTNNNVYPGRGYGKPGYPNQYPRPVPYPGGPPPYNRGGVHRTNNPTIPATRPYNPERARSYPANPNFAKPNFPKPSTLPNNAGMGNQKRNELAQNQPIRQGNPVASARPAVSRPANRAADPARGFTTGNNPRGARNSALGGYEPGGAAQASRNRGQASFKGNGGARSSGPGRDREGGNDRRGQGNGNRGGRRG